MLSRYDSGPCHARYFAKIRSFLSVLWICNFHRFHPIELRDLSGLPLGNLILVAAPANRSAASCCLGKLLNVNLSFVIKKPRNGTCGSRLIRLSLCRNRCHNDVQKGIDPQVDNTIRPHPPPQRKLRSLRASVSSAPDSAPLLKNTAGCPRGAEKLNQFPSDTGKTAPVQRCVHSPTGR
jgi:hypothetical protein